MTALVPLELSLPPIRFTEEAEDARAAAIVKATGIESVHDADSQSQAVDAQRALRKLLSEAEKSRKEVKEPVLEAGRLVDKTVAEFVESLKAHELRLAKLCGDYQQSELEKVRAAERAAQAERDRIAREQAEALAAAERAAKAERDRIAKEQAEALAAAERKAAEERKAATNAAERKAAEERAEAARKAAEERAEAERKAAAERLAAEQQRQQELAIQQTESLPAVTTPNRADGQSIRQEWEIKSISEFALMRARPDLVRKVEFDLRTIKEELARGIKLPGVEAQLVVKSSVRLGREKEPINV